MQVIPCIFYFLSFLAVFSGIMMVASKSPVNSVLYLIITFFAIAGHYLLLNAQFLAVVHIVVYAGAIMVLFLFVLMLLNLNHETEPQKNMWLKGAAVVSALCLMLVLVAALKGAENLTSQHTINHEVGLIKNLGRVLFNEYLFPFEISSVLLLGAMVGAVFISKKSSENEVELSKAEK